MGNQPGSVPMGSRGLGLRAGQPWKGQGWSPQGHLSTDSPGSSWGQQRLCGELREEREPGERGRQKLSANLQEPSPAIFPEVCTYTHSHTDTHSHTLTHTLTRIHTSMPPSSELLWTDTRDLCLREPGAPSNWAFALPGLLLNSGNRSHG